MIPKTLDNPFVVQRVGRDIVPPPGNVPELHQGVREHCRRLIRQVRQTGHGVSLLVGGEAGSGKTHLVTQLRMELADDPAAFVIRIGMDQATVGQIWRYVRRQVVEELLRKRWHPQNHELSGLLRVIQNAFPQWTPSGQRGVMGLPFGSKTAYQHLTEELGRFAEDNEFTYELRQVLPRLWQTGMTNLAGDWLRGKPLSDDDLKKLGLPINDSNEFAQETTARDVVTSLFRLAVHGGTTLLICFDEVEALLTGGDDTIALRAFTNLATDMIAESGQRVVVTFVRSKTILTLKKNVEHSNVQKMSQTEASIPPLEWEHVVPLVIARLNADPACRAERAKRTNERFWPLDEKFLRDLYNRERRDITARHLIIACRVEFDRLQKGVAPPPVPPAVAGPKPGDGVSPPPEKITPTPPPPPPPPEEPTPEQLRQMWAKQRAHHFTRLAALKFDVVIGNGLRWLARITDAPFETSDEADKRVVDFDLVFKPTTPGGKPIGVSTCHQDPQSLWRRLDRLICQAQAAKAHDLLGRMILVRAADPPLSTAARERIEKIRRGGAVVLLIPKEQLADFAAFQTLQSKFQMGDITILGKPIPADVFDAWAKTNLTPAVKELADAIFGSGVISPPPVTVPAVPPAATVKAAPAKPAAVKPEPPKPEPPKPEPPKPAATLFPTHAKPVAKPPAKKK